MNGQEIRRDIPAQGAGGPLDRGADVKEFEIEEDPPAVRLELPCELDPAIGEESRSHLEESGHVAHRLDQMRGIVDAPGIQRDDQPIARVHPGCQPVPFPVTA